MKRVACLLSGALALSILAPLPLVLAEDAPPATQPAKVEPVDYKKLKEFLPEKVGTLARTSSEGSTTSMGDMKLSQASGEYHPENSEPTADIEITDYGAMPGMAEVVGAFGKVEINKEGDDGYEKTYKIGNWPAHEEYQKESKDGELTIFVGNRFIVEISTSNMDPAVLKATAESMKLDDLAQLK
jgi:hypothetical protein